MAEGAKPNQKDTYDKISALAPLLGGSVVALIVGLATLSFNATQAERNSKFQEIDAIAKMMPYLTSEKPSQVDWALRVLVALDVKSAAAFLSTNTGQVGAQIRSELAKAKDPAVRIAVNEAQQQSNQLTRNAQEYLIALGLYEGVIDGSYNSEFLQAVQKFQKQHGLDADGIVGPVTYSAIQAEAATALQEPPARTAVQKAQQQSNEINRNTQKKLTALGLYDGPIDGSYNPQFYEAVQKFQKQHGLDADGIVGPITSAEIDAAAASASRR